MNLLNDYTTISISDHTYISLSNHVWLGLFFLVIAAFFRFSAVANCGACNRLFEPVQPNLVATPSPIDRVTVGAVDCFACLIKRIIFWIFIAVAVDQIVFSGIGLERLLEWLSVFLGSQ